LNGGKTADGGISVFWETRGFFWQVAKSGYRLILDFHGLGPAPDWVDEAEREYWCEEDYFKSILDQVQTLSQVIPIQLTFDDGNLSDATIALPALADRGLTASFFVCAGRIGLPGYLDKIAMHDLVTAGMGIGSHGWAHLDWRCVNDETLDMEIDRAPMKIADVIGCAVDQASIPFGSYDSRVLRRLRRSGMKAVFTSDGGPAPLTGWMLPREVFKKMSWDITALGELANGRTSLRSMIRRAIVRFIKRHR
jgi:peptidoglycan/xylan/chitin deacetylase (PgdA/CDA1 family)